MLITTEPSVPFKMMADDGKTIIGSTADKIHEMLRRAQIPYQMQMMAWNRAYELAKTQTDTCVFETARTPERESSFKWIGPVSKGSWAIYGSTSQIGKVTHLSDIKDATIGGYVGDAIGEYLANHGFHVINSYDDEITLKNLLKGRLDFWASDTTQAPRMIAKLHLQDAFTQLFVFGTFEYYLACNPKTSNERIDALRARLKEIHTDGTEAKIDARYANWPTAEH